MDDLKNHEDTARSATRQGRIPASKFPLAPARRAPKTSAMFIAWTSVARRAEAERLARDAVARGLAACVQIEGPIVSHYSWQGRAERAEEFRLCFKCCLGQLAALETQVLADHPNDTPEWLVVRAEHVGEKYLSWAQANATFPPFHSSQPPL